ncbi:MAG: hypothetical protein OXG56_03970 [Gammaproteobacteria bacterium]|nr:hypothetical protein [Gammaproteobacteria bacterium]
MTLDKARQLIRVQADFGGSYNRHSAQLILAEVSREHGQAAVDQLITEFRLSEIFDFEVGQEFT